MRHPKWLERERKGAPKLEKWIKNAETEADKYGIFPHPTEAQEALNILKEHFLGADWYVVDPISTTQINTDALLEIIQRYPSGKIRRIQKKKGN